MCVAVGSIITYIAFNVLVVRYFGFRISRLACNSHIPGPGVEQGSKITAVHKDDQGHSSYCFTE